MDALTVMRVRRSAKRLTDPAPIPEHLQAMLEAAALAPDHKEMRPWRFIVLEGDDKSAFSQVLVDALVRRDPEATSGMIDKARTALDRAPMVVVVAAKRLEAKIPFEELYAAVAAATQNLLLAATALGYGSIWRTGAHAFDPNVKVALGLDPADEIVGFIYIGTAAGELPAPRLPELDDVVSYWKKP